MARWRTLNKRRKRERDPRVHLRRQMRDIQHEAVKAMRGASTLREAFEITARAVAGYALLSILGPTSHNVMERER